MLEPKILDPTKILQNYWRQGAGLLIDSTKKIYIRTQDDALQLQLKDGLYILLSQDCDIVNSCLEKEPVVEIIETNQIPLCNPEFSSGKNPRLLHLTIANGSTLEFLPYKRYFIPRHYLETISASSISVEGRQLDILKRWIYKRTVRSAFPDSFNGRIKKNIKHIKRILGNEAKDSLGLFIRLASEKELPAEQAYKVLIKMLVSKTIFNNEQALRNIEKGFDQIITILDNTNGIEVIEGSQVQSMDDISAHLFFELKQWDFDYISFSNNEDGEVIEEELI